jgi:hypothetical protein
MPWKTQELIHKICTEFYKNDPDGLIGNEDCGQMSAWYILSAMGFYPVCPGNGEYVLGTPLFDEVTINLENGKKFVIRKQQTANGKKENNSYVTATKLNGKTSTKSYLLHTDVMKGGVLEFTMDKQPSKTWGTNLTDLPNSKISDNQIIPVPYFDVESNKFKSGIKINVDDIDKTARIRTRIGDMVKGISDFNGFDYLELTETKDVFAVAQKDGKQSKIVMQKFFKTPSDKSITVLSKVSSMYTAGGPDALIDSIEGTTNWRTGEWQSYYNQDFEAIIDLQETKPVSYVGIHVLQDISPWIMYPKEVIFYSSDDGKNFIEASRVENKIGQSDGPAQTQTLGTNVNIQTRYIKVKAITGGKLPAWHESAGNPSHIFIDEIIVK